MNSAAPESLRSGRAFAAVFAQTFCGLVAVGAVLPVLPGYVKAELGYGDFVVGVVVGCYAVSGLLLRPVAGRLADTRGRKLTALGGSLLLSAAGFLYLAPLGLAGLIVARLILGVGEGTLYTSTSAWIVDLSPPARRGRLLGLFGLSVWGGLSVGPLLGAVAMGAGFSLLNPSLMLIVVGQVSAAARGAALGTFTAFFDLGVGVGAPLAGLAAALISYEAAFILASAVALGSAAMIYLTVHSRQAQRA